MERDKIVIVEVSDIGWHNLEPLMQLRLQNGSFRSRLQLRLKKVLDIGSS